MGGASVQIAVELNVTSGIDESVESINLGCKDNEQAYRFFPNFIIYSLQLASQRTVCNKLN